MPPFSSPFKLHIPKHGYVVMGDKDYEQATLGPAAKATVFTARESPGGRILEFKDKTLGTHTFDDLPLIPKPVCTLPLPDKIPSHQLPRLRYAVEIKQHGVNRRVVLAIDDISRVTPALSELG